MADTAAPHTVETAAALTEAEQESLCACGYGVVCQECMGVYRRERDAALAEVERVKWVAEVHLSRRGLWASEVGLAIRDGWATDLSTTPASGVRDA